MGNYVEEYSIKGLNLGIEDFKSPGRHFFLDQQERRFQCWVTGCGICSGHDTVEEARKHLMRYAIERFTQEAIEKQRRVSEIQDAITKLEELTYVGLESFKVEVKNGRR